MATCTIVNYEHLIGLVGFERPSGVARLGPLTFNASGEQSPVLPYRFTTIQSDKPFKIRFGDAGTDPEMPDASDHRYGANPSDPMLFPHVAGARFKIIEVA